MHCYFCNEPSSDIVCDSPECQKEDAEIRKNIREAEEIKLRVGIKKAFAERAKCEDDYCLNRAQRWFYTFKCIICAKTNRRRPVSAGNYPTVIKVSTIYFNGTWPSDWEAAWLQVGHGIFKQWWYDILEDGEFIY